MGSKTIWLQAGLVLAAAFVLAGCSGTASERSARSSGAVTGLGTGTGTGGVGSTSGLSQTCANGGSAVGYVTSGSPTSGTFRDNVAGFLSSFMDSSQLGQIAEVQPDASTGVDLQLYLSVTNGALNLGGTQIQLSVYDSLVGNKNSDGTMVQPITFGMASASSGQVNMSAHTFTVTFQDGYGSITLQGSWNGSSAQGTISYQNSQNKAGGAPASGMLGGFVVPTCGLF